MSASRTARDRVRAELTLEITGIARRQLATEGAAGLNLRAIAREMGMASSAIYRYFASRDELLTALIIDAYNAVGEAVEQADASRPRDDHRGRWFAVCRAVRGWAVAHPHEYALLYGSPVPGYQAPQDTIGPALRDTVVYVRILGDAYKAGALTSSGSVETALAEDLTRVRQAVGADIPDVALIRGMTAWAALFGTVSFEVFGQFDNVIDQREAYFDQAMTGLADFVGL